MKKQGFIRNGMIICSLFLFSCTSTIKEVPLKPPSKIAEELNRLTSEQKIQEDLEIEIGSWIGTPYRYGQNSKKGTDCSGFVSQIYRKIYNKKLQRSSQGMLLHNCTPINKADLKIGDLVFFLNNTQKNAITNHVGIYVGENNFAHATINIGVTISNLNEPYYKETFVTAARVK